jgi:hypothetical protein
MTLADTIAILRRIVAALQWRASMSTSPSSPTSVFDEPPECWGNIIHISVITPKGDVAILMFPRDELPPGCTIEAVDNGRNDGTFGIRFVPLQ